MDQISLMKSNIKYDYWKKTIEDCQASGKTVVSYCKENNVNEKTYYYWLRIILQYALLSSAYNMEYV